VLTEDPVRPRAIDSQIPEMLELVIQRAMAKDAQERYASMSEFDKALAIFTDTASLGIPSGVAMVPVARPEPLAQRTGAAGALDVAKAMLGTGSHSPPPPQSNIAARAARPTIVVASVVFGSWLLGGTVAALAGLVRVLHDGEITLTESLLLVVGCLFAAATPLALYVMHIKSIIWPNSVRSVQLANDLKRISTVALVTYGAFSALGRIGHTVFWRSSRGLVSGGWDMGLFAVSLVAVLTVGSFPSLVRTLRGRRRD